MPLCPITGVSGDRRVVLTHVPAAPSPSYSGPDWRTFFLPLTLLQLAAVPSRLSATLHVPNVLTNDRTLPHSPLGAPLALGSAHPSDQGVQQSRQLLTDLSRAALLEQADDQDQPAGPDWATSREIVVRRLAFKTRTAAEHSQPSADERTICLHVRHTSPAQPLRELENCSQATGWSELRPDGPRREGQGPRGGHGAVRPPTCRTPWPKSRRAGCASIYSGAPLIFFTPLRSCSCP